MKILCTADIHIGQTSYGHIDPSNNLNTRTIHTLNVLDDMIQYAIDNCEMFIFAGDMFKNNLPSPTLQDEVYKRIKKLNDNKIHTILLDGNHDVSRLETSKSSLKAFDTFKLSYIHHSKFYKEIDINNINFVMLPTYTTREEIQKTLKDFNKPTILIGHFTLLGAALNDWLIDTNEANISTDDLNKANVKAVILGHLHRHQILNTNPLMLYTGSPTRIDFTEEEQEKGFVVLDTSDYSYQFIQTNSEQFKTIRIDISELEEGIDVNDYIYQQLNKVDVKDKITRVILTLTTTQIIDEKLIYKTLSDAKSLANIQKKYINKKYTRNSNITNDLTISKSIEVYYKDKERSKERIKLAKEILKTLDIQ